MQNEDLYIATLREELLNRGDYKVTICQVLELFDDVEKNYSGEPWTYKQIITVINQLVGEPPKSSN